MLKLKSKIQKYLASLDASCLRRVPLLMPSGCLNFSSNDYLGLSTHKTLQKAYRIGFKKYPTGSTGSMVVSGYHAPHRTLEMAFSHALQVDKALLFPSGYAANLSIMQLLAKLKIHALIDKGLHASFYDGLRLSGTAYTRYPHDHLTNQLTPPEETVLITESIFSMSGAQPNLQALSSKYPLIVDEAHAFGVLGPKGLGGVAQYALTQDKVPLRVIPFGKALGLTGAMVAGDGDWITALLQSARPLIYSTAMSPALAYGLLEAFQRLQAADEARAILYENIKVFRENIKQSSLTWQDSKTPIQQLRLGCPKKANAFTQKLQEKNIYCVSMREPTVPRLATGLRIVLNSSHTPDNIHYLFECLHQCEISI